MQYIALQVVVVLVNRLLGEELVFWPQVRGLTISKGSGLRNSHVVGFFVQLQSVPVCCDLTFCDNSNCKSIIMIKVNIWSL